MTATPTELLLSEEYVQNCFHSYLKSALTQAKVERLLDTETLSSAEADLMITGPALCLYFAALRSTTNPPSVPLPRLTKSRSPPTDLSLSNCPVPFRPFLTVWASTVQPIQALLPEHQHDLARIVCGLPPLTHPPNLRLDGIAADLRAVAIEISMRRTFQDRYAQDLQAAIDAGRTGAAVRVKASFVPPPVYDEAIASPPPLASPTSLYAPQSPKSPSHRSHSPTSPSSRSLQISSPTSLSPRSLRTSSSSRSLRAPSPSPSQASSSLRAPSPSPSHASSSRAPSPQPTILGPESPAIEFIRETLYAALADVLERVPSLRRLLARNPARGYFAAVAYAILDVAATSVSFSPESRNNPVIYGVLGRSLALHDCPMELQPFMRELCAIGADAHAMEDEDTDASVRALQEDPSQELPAPRMDRVRQVLRGGVGWVYDDQNSDNDDEHEHELEEAGRGRGYTERGERRRTTSTQNRAVAFANRINALALGMTKLRAFKERQEAVFQVLVGVGSGGGSKGATVTNGTSATANGAAAKNGVVPPTNGNTRSPGKLRKSRWQ